MSDVILFIFTRHDAAGSGFVGEASHCYIHSRTLSRPPTELRHIQSEEDTIPGMAYTTHIIQLEKILS